MNHVDWIVRSFIPEFMERYGCKEQVVALRGRGFVADLNGARSVLSACCDGLQSELEKTNYYKVMDGSLDKKYADQMRCIFKDAHAFIDGHRGYAAAFAALREEYWGPWRAARANDRSKLVDAARLGQSFNDFCSKDVAAVINVVTLLHASRGAES